MTLPAAAELAAEHRRLDDLLGGFFAAAARADLPEAGRAMAEFDDALRRHTSKEETTLLAPPSGHKLAPPEGESAGERLHRELRLEHVQVRELSAMIRRLLDEQADLEGARRLAGALARRWDAHISREERELLG